MKNFLEFVRVLESQNIHSTIAVNTPNALMVTVSIPGQLLEVEFTDDGQIECEVFRSKGNVEVLSLSELIARLGTTTLPNEE